MNLTHLAKTVINRHCDVKSFKVVAIALRNGTPICVECNRRRDGDGNGRWSYHAENRLIRKLRKRGDLPRFPHIDILVLRIGDGELRMAKPCAMCAWELNFTTGLRHVDYSTNTGDIERLF